MYTHNVVVNNIDNRRISYNGGPNGIRRMADPREAAARNEAHTPPTAAQRFARSAGADRGQFFEHNQAPAAPSWNTARTGRRLPARWRTESRRRPARRSPQRFRLPQHQHRAASGPEPRRPRPAPERARRAAAGAARRSLLARRSRRRRRFANRRRSPACSGRNAVPTIWRSPCTTNGSAAADGSARAQPASAPQANRPAPPQRHEERGGDRPERGGGDRGGGNRGGGGGHGRD